MSDPHPPLRSYGRLKTRTIKPRQAALMETLLPTLRPPAEPFDPRALMPAAKEVWLEIGFGGGEHMAAQAARAPDVLILGAEPFQNGVASALRHIDEAQLTNVRVLDGDARERIELDRILGPPLGLRQQRLYRVGAKREAFCQQPFDRAALRRIEGVIHGGGMNQQRGNGDLKLIGLERD